MKQVPQPAAGGATRFWGRETSVWYLEVLVEPPVGPSEDELRKAPIGTRDGSPSDP